MKVLLRKNVSKLGTIGDVIEVKPGYARNYLIPQCLAVAPTEVNLKQVEAEKEHYLAELAKLREQLQVRADAADGKEITIASRANEEGHLYGSVGPAQIAAALSEAGVTVEPSEVRLDQPIRQLDKYDVTLEFAEDITASVGVWIVPLREDGTAGEPSDIPPRKSESPSVETTEQTVEQPAAETDATSETETVENVENTEGVEER